MDSSHPVTAFGSPMRAADTNPMRVTPEDLNPLFTRGSIGIVA